MRLSFGQELRQVQKQMLAPRMIQSMEILQLPLLALQERIEQEIQENPVLDVKEVDPNLPDERYESDKVDDSADAEKELVVDETKNNEEDFERLLNMNDEWPGTFEERSRPSADRIEQESSRKHDTMANMANRPQTLQDHLHNQVGWFDLDEDLRQLVDRIIYNLDANGRLQGQLQDLLKPDAPPERLRRAEEALDIVQRLDPPGVGARDDRECLLLQIKPGIPFYEELKKLIEHHLEDLAGNRLPIISRKTGYSIEQIHRIWDELKKLNPHPGAIFKETHVHLVTPDVYVERNDDGKYVVRIDDDRTPDLYISPYYRKLLSNPDTTPETKEYIKRKINAAQWLIESIQQRRSTLTRVSQAIVDHQTEFLDKGPEAIEPLKMQQIADKVGVHVTTVSRAVDDKWIQTARGIFPLKRFFVGGTRSADGEEVAWDAVRLKLQEIIDNEDKKKPHSDDELVRQLANHGLKVARRTVTKYRKSMNIPSSRQRRDWLNKEA
jgi:RNA polymerase sigma-54 factor